MPGPDLRTLLRRSTRARHARVDALFPAGFTGRDDYAAYLRGMHALLATAAPALPELAPRLPLLAGDLRALAAPPPAAPAAPVAAAAAFTPERALGWRYVIHGSALGARVLLRQAASLGATPRRGARFLAAHATGGDWDATVAALAAGLPAKQVDGLLAAADEAFAAAGAAFLAARTVAATGAAA